MFWVEQRAVLTNRRTHYSLERCWVTEPAYVPYVHDNRSLFPGVVQLYASAELCPKV